MVLTKVDIQDSKGPNLFIISYILPEVVYNGIAHQKGIMGLGTGRIALGKGTREKGRCTAPCHLRMFRQKGMRKP